MRLRSLLMGRDSVPVSELLAWFKAQRRHAAEGTPRHSAYALLIQTIEHLAHTRDLSTIPAHKLEKLCARARVECGWEQHRPPPLDANLPLPPDHKQCTRCRLVKHAKEFRRRATDRERAHYGWSNKVSVRWVASAYCGQCRTARIKRERKKARAAALNTHPLYALSRRLANALKSTKHRLKAARTGTAVPDFYRERARCLNLAIGVVDEHINTGVSLPEKTRSDWTLLLPEEDRKRLFDLYGEVLSQHLPGRTPAI